MGTDPLADTQEETMWELNGKKHLQEREENFTFLGRGVDFKGVIRFDGTVRIDGQLEGEIHAKGTLIIGEHAAIKGLIVYEASDYGQARGIRAPNGRLRAAERAVRNAIRQLRESIAG